MGPFVVKISGLVIVFFLFWIIRRIFAPHKSFTDFFLGDNGRYSLSRVQAAVWAYIIMAYQVSVLVALCNINFDVAAKLFTLVFSEQVLWLLGLSLGTYVTVKGIAVNQMTTSGKPVVSGTVQRNWADLVSTDGRLDLSRFQMFIWTLIAVVAFTISYFHYIELMIKAAAATGSSDPTALLGVLKPFFPVFGEDKDQVLPTVDMSFIVLMGLSHGTYIGRKLVPDFKVNEVTTDYRQSLTTRSDAIDIGLKFKEMEYELIRDSPQVSIDQKVAAQKELDALRLEKQKIATELSALPPVTTPVQPVPPVQS